LRKRDVMATKRKLGGVTEVGQSTQHSSDAVDVNGLTRTIESLKDGMAAASAGFEKSQASMQQSTERALATAAALTSFGQSNVEAFAKTGQLWASGFQELHKHMAAALENSFYGTLSTLKAVTAIGSLKDALVLGANIVQTGTVNSPSGGGSPQEAEPSMDAPSATLDSGNADSEPNGTDEMGGEEANHEIADLLERINRRLDEAEARAERLLSDLA
jgi:hypothetical protein